MLALKHWKSQEAASYSPAVTLFFFFAHAAFVLGGRRDCHSRPCTRSCTSFYAGILCNSRSCPSLLASRRGRLTW